MTAYGEKPKAIGGRYALGVGVASDRTFSFFHLDLSGILTFVLQGQITSLDPHSLGASR